MSRKGPREWDETCPIGLEFEPKDLKVRKMERWVEVQQCNVNLEINREKKRREKRRSILLPGSSISCGKMRSRGRVKRQIRILRVKKPASAIWGEPAARLLRIKVRWGGWRKVIVRCDVERVKPSIECLQEQTPFPAVCRTMDRKASVWSMCVGPRKKTLST